MTLTNRPLLVCVDNKHQYICFQPCEACEDECDRAKLRLATENERRMWEEGRDDPGFIGIVNEGV